MHTKCGLFLSVMLVYSPSLNAMQKGNGEAHSWKTEEETVGGDETAPKYVGKQKQVLNLRKNILMALGFTSNTTCFVYNFLSV